MDDLVRSPDDKSRAAVTHSHPSSNGFGPGAELVLPPQQGQNAIIAEALTALRCWWWQCSLVGAVLAAAAGAAVYLTFKPEFEATSLVVIKERPDYIAFPQQNGSNTYAETQLETLRSPIVLSRVAAKPDVVRRQEKSGIGEISVEQWLAKGVKARFIGRSELCQITFRAHDPTTAALVVNSVVDEYLSLHQDSESEQAERIIELLNAQQRERQSEVENMRERVRTLTKKATGYDPIVVSGDSNVVLRQNPLAELDQRRIAAEVEHDVRAAELQAMQEASAAEKFEVPPDELELAVEEHPVIQRLQNQVAVLKSQLSDHERRSAVGRKDATLLTRQKEVQLAEQELKAQREKLRPALEDEWRRSYAAEQAQFIRELKTKVDLQRRMVAQWAEKVKKQRQESEKHGNEALDLQFAQDDLARSEEVYALIAQRIIAMKTEKVAPARAVKRHPATPPTAPLEAVPVKQLSMACLGAFCVPFGLAFLCERLMRRISDSHRLSVELNLPVLGEIATLPSRRGTKDFRSAGFVRERVTFEESIDSLRVGLTLPIQSRDLQTLLVTSAVSGEGKTNLTSSLAISLARASQERVLLIDADMRDPDLHDIFDVPAAPGLAEVLSNGHALDEAIVATDMRKVDLLPAGELSVTPHFLLRNGAFESLLKQLKSRYRYILVDSPPVLSASESVVLAHACDGVVICTRCDFSRSRQLRSASDRLLAAGARVLGAVISGVPTRTWAYRSGGYGYGWERYAAAADRVAQRSEEADLLAHQIPLNPQTKSDV